MSSYDRRIIFQQIFLNLPVFHTSYFVSFAESDDPGISGFRQTSKTDAMYFVTKTQIFVFYLLATLGGLWWSTPSHAASCEAIVGRWAWFIGGEVTVNPDGTFVQQSGNAGIWECTDVARGNFIFRWRDGGFVNSLALSPDGQGLTSRINLNCMSRREDQALQPNPRWSPRRIAVKKNIPVKPKRLKPSSNRNWPSAIIQEM